MLLDESVVAVSRIRGTASGQRIALLHDQQSLLG
jgi:hypothetical protein